MKNRGIREMILNLGVVLLLISCAGTTPPVVPEIQVDHVGSTAAEDFPRVQREFRAAWVATVANIDWPSRPGLSVAEQQTEAWTIMDTAAALGLNALVFQVRPQCDALYASDLEPWSYYLTGEQGRAPEPYYDPLEFWIEECHKRGLELHAWFNPYRAHHPQGGEPGPRSLVHTRPELVRELPKGYFWLDPAMQEVQDHSYAVVMDVVQRYDVDGVHFDDYFYPYGDGSFPDEEAWQDYVDGGGELDRKDWRRDNVNRFIQRVYKGIKASKPWVKFGLSPFGIWRPGNPPSIRGFDQYDRLYADAKLWLNQGWVDYWTPQLYWPTRQIPQSFPVLLGWWTEENLEGRNLWPGLFTSKISDEAGAAENFSQIMITRGMLPRAPGHVHFSIKAILQNYGGIKEVLRKPYAEPALVPPSPWLDALPPAAPLADVTVTDSTVIVLWDHPDPTDVFRWVVYVRRGQDWTIHILNRDSRSDRIALRGIGSELKPVQEIRVTAVDRVGNESEPVRLPVSLPES